MTTVKPLDALQSVYSESELDQLVRKLLQAKLDQTLHDIDRYERDLRAFEKQYGMSSDVMNEKFESGELGDDADYFEWSGLYAVYRSVKRQIYTIEQAL
jgi:hypothetical protein